MALRSRVHWPRRTVRLRLTALYGGLFLASGAGLLAITYALVAGQPMRAFFQVAGTVRGSVTLLPAKARVLVPPPAPGGVFITRSASGGPPRQRPQAGRHQQQAQGQFPPGALPDANSSVAGVDITRMALEERRLETCLLAE